MKKYTVNLSLPTDVFNYIDEHVANEYRKRLGHYQHLANKPMTTLQIYRQLGKAKDFPAIMLGNNKLDVFLYINGTTVQNHIIAWEERIVELYLLWGEKAEAVREQRLRERLGLDN